MTSPAAKLREIFAAQGVRAAVIHLNHQTEHRFTAVLRFERISLTSLAFYDRLNPQADKCDDIPMEASYCIIVKRQKAPLVIADAAKDPRANGHPAQSTVLAYCGFPLTDEAGKVYGTMCHFDLVPRPENHEPLELMAVMADLLRQGQGLRKPA